MGGVQEIWAGAQDVWAGAQIACDGLQDVWAGAQEKSAESVVSQIWPNS